MVISKRQVWSHDMSWPDFYSDCLVGKSNKDNPIRIDQKYKLMITAITQLWGHATPNMQLHLDNNQDTPNNPHGTNT